MSLCCVCDGVYAPMHTCHNPHCGNRVCERHVLRFEIDNTHENAVYPFCSRTCFNAVRKRTLPTSKELLIAFTVLAVAFSLYIAVVLYFTP